MRVDRTSIVVFQVFKETRLAVDSMTVVQGGEYAAGCILFWEKSISDPKAVRKSCAVFTCEETVADGARDIALDALTEESLVILQWRAHGLGAGGSGRCK